MLYGTKMIMDENLKWMMGYSEGQKMGVHMKKSKNKK